MKWSGQETRQRIVKINALIILASALSAVLVIVGKMIYTAVI